MFLCGRTNPQLAGVDVVKTQDPSFCLGGDLKFKHQPSELARLPLLCGGYDRSSRPTILCIGQPRVTVPDLQGRRPSRESLSQPSVESRSPSHFSSSWRVAVSALSRESQSQPPVESHNHSPQSHSPQSRVTVPAFSRESQSQTSVESHSPRHQSRATVPALSYDSQSQSSAESHSPSLSRESWSQPSAESHSPVESHIPALSRDSLSQPSVESHCPRQRPRPPYMYLYIRISSLLTLYKVETT